MSEDITPVAPEEYSIIGKAITEKLSQCADIPAGTVIDYQSVEGIGHIGYITMPGGKYTSRDIYGGFEAQMPFQIAYKTAGTGNIHMLDAEALMESIAVQLSAKPYPMLTGNRRIRRIDFDSITYRSEAAPDGSMVYVRNGAVRYEYNI